MRLSKLQSSSLAILTAISLSGCRDKQELGFLGDIEVGKYQITQYKEYPNGLKDTLSWEAYGPWYQKAGYRYYFDLHDTSYISETWEIFEGGILYNYPYQLDSWSVSYTTDVVNIQTDFIQMNYSYFDSNMTIGTDSASGYITFQRIPQ